MSKNDKAEIQWLREPEDHDYPAAKAYLSLIYDESVAETYVEKMKNAPMADFKSYCQIWCSGIDQAAI